MQMKTVVIACLVNQLYQVLLSQRQPYQSYAGMWEFPGGKVEKIETPRQALSRELREELGIDALPENFKSVGFVDYSREENFYLILMYSCNIWKKEVIPREGQKIKWQNIDNLNFSSMIPHNVALKKNITNILGRS